MCGLSLAGRRGVVWGAAALFEAIEEGMDLLMTGGASGECFGGEKSSFRAGFGVLFLAGGCSGVLAVGLPLFSTGGEPLDTSRVGETTAEEGDTEVGDVPLRG